MSSVSWFSKISFLPHPSKELRSVPVTLNKQRTLIYTGSEILRMQKLPFELQPKQLSTAALTFKCNGPPLSQSVDSAQKGVLKVLNSISTSMWTILHSIPGSQHKGVLTKSTIQSFAPIRILSFHLPANFLLYIFHGWEAKHKKRGRIELGVIQTFVQNLWNFLALKSWANYLPSLILPFHTWKMVIKASYFMEFFFFF